MFAHKPEDERSDGVAKLQNDYVLAADAEIIRRVWELAEHYGVSTSVIAQAWNLAKPVVTSPLIGASKTKYIDDAIASLELSLTADEMAYLEEPYVPHAQYGFRWEQEARPVASAAHTMDAPGRHAGVFTRRAGHGAYDGPDLAGMSCFAHA